MDLFNRLINDYENVPDLIVKKIKNIYIIYLESLASQDKINDYILKVVSTNKVKKDIKELIPSPNVKDISNYDELLSYLNTGFSIIFNNLQIIAVETKENLNRSISSPTTEATLYGPKEALTENIQTNLGLIKRRIKASNLKNKVLNIGLYTNTTLNILYIDSIIKKPLLNKIINKLNNISIDGITDINELKPFLTNDNKNVFPALKLTERPDVIASALLKGKVVIILDNSPNALIIPSFLVEYLNPISDDYSKSININFIKILRFLCFFFSIITPAFYVAITTINQETIPTDLLINFQNQRQNVPFPALVECLITLLAVEILKESDIRFPSTYGSAISILGGLILGEAAVEAGIICPIMIIVVASTFISSMIFTDTEIVSGIRFWRFIFLIIASFFGIYGVGLALILLIANLANYEVFNMPYFYPISPFDFTYIKQTLIKMKNNKRSKYLSNNRIKGDL